MLCHLVDICSLLLSTEVMIRHKEADTEHIQTASLKCLTPHKKMPASFLCLSLYSSSVIRTAKGIVGFLLNPTKHNQRELAAGFFYLMMPAVKQPLIT